MVRYNNHLTDLAKNVSRFPNEHSRWPVGARKVH
jgi:hypothetical protein